MPDTEDNEDFQLKRRAVLGSVAAAFVSGCTSAESSPCGPTESLEISGQQIEKIRPDWMGSAVAGFTIMFNPSDHSRVLKLITPEPDTAREQTVAAGRTQLKFDLTCLRETVGRGCNGSPHGRYKIELRKGDEIQQQVIFWAVEDDIGCSSLKRTLSEEETD